MADGPKPPVWQELIATEILTPGREYVLPDEWSVVLQSLHETMVRGMVENGLKEVDPPRLRFDHATHPEEGPTVSVSLLQWGSPEDG